MNQTKYNIIRTLGILLGAAVLLTLPIFFLGMPGGNDLPQHYRFAISFYDALHSGDVYPAWAGDTNLGYGDAGVRFYPPLAYYILALFRFFVSSWNAALALAICFWFFVGSLGFYALAREWFSEKASLGAALVFMVMPYHVNQVYNAGLFAEFAGLAILPFCFLFARKIVSDGGLTSVAGLSVSYSLLILSHLPLSIVGSAGLLLFTLVLMRDARWDAASIGKLIVSVGISAAATAFYWVRLVSELSFVKHSLPQFTGQTYDFRFNFLASMFYVPAEKYEQTSLWFTDLLFVITLAMIVPALFICLKTGGEIDRRKVVPILAVLAFALILGTPVSAVLWEHIGLLQKIQFPWRLLGLLSLAGCLIIAAFFEELPRVFRSNRRPLGIIAVGLIIAGGVFTFAQVIRPATYPDRPVFENSFERYRADESYECWWPIWAERRAFADREQVSGTSRSVTVTQWTSDDREILVGEGDAERIRVATFYYPFWKATSNGSILTVEPAEDGTIQISVPAGVAHVRLVLEQPFHETLVRIVSLSTWVALLLTLTVFQIPIRKIV